jgi:DNA excision repair protein ERCC-4
MGVADTIGGYGEDEPNRVVVDVREFRASLPSLLHQQGMEIVPVTLEVGDFVLSPNICVERKSVPDLFGSFQSGRLYTQANAMSRHYEHPTLLIEFSAERSFSLQSSSDLPSEIQGTNVISKMVLLALHCPQLRILWSRSPHATVSLFRRLKEDQPEADTNAALAKGQESGGDDGLGGGVSGAGGGASEGTSTARELLRRCPGVTPDNIRELMRAAPNLAELSQLSEKKLADAIGKSDGGKLYRFFRRRE